jgi:hypothetical protein
VRGVAGAWKAWPGRAGALQPGHNSDTGPGLSGPGPSTCLVARDFIFSPFSEYFGNQYTPALPVSVINIRHIRRQCTPSSSCFDVPWLHQLHRAALLSLRAYPLLPGLSQHHLHRLALISLRLKPVRHSPAPAADGSWVSGRAARPLRGVQGAAGPAQPAPALSRVAGQRPSPRAASLRWPLATMATPPTPVPASPIYMYTRKAREVRMAAPPTPVPASPRPHGLRTSRALRAQAPSTCPPPLGPRRQPL